MSISSINFGTSLLGQSIRNINNQLTDLSTQLSTGLKSTTYAGMGVSEGFAVAARSQLANIDAFTNTITTINTTISAANTALQTLSQIAGQVQGSAASSPRNVASNGQTIGQQNALSELSAVVGILNTQVGSRYIFSGTAVNTQAVASPDLILNGTTTQAGLKQVIAERAQADGTTTLGRLVITSPTATSVQVAEDVAGSPFGLKLNSVSSTLTGATVTGPTGSPAAISVALGGVNPNPGEQVSFSFNLPDGTSESIQLTASNTVPLPTGSFAIGLTPTATTANLNAALNTTVGTLANTKLLAASAVEAGNDFFSPAGLAVGSVVNNQAATPAPITGATLLSGVPTTDSLASSFAPGNTITVNGTAITFVLSGATGNQLNVTDSVQNLLTKIDSITGTSTPSTIGGGAITLRTDSAASLNISTTNPAALAALGFGGGTVSAIQPPLRVSGPPFSSATALVSGTPANTVSWYTGNSGPGSARSSSTARIDQAQTIDYGAQANEFAIRNALQSISVYAAVTESPTAANSAAQVGALSDRISANLTPRAGQQTFAEIQTDFAIAQSTIKDAQSRQTQAHTMLQNLVSNTEGISKDEVASQLLALQTSLQASYQVTSMLSQLSLTKFLPIG
jgi:flagellar hook-associated protein 3 FlgL